MASVRQNFSLGFAGLVDLVGRQTGLYSTHYAADVYANQVAEDPGLADSAVVSSMAAQGVTAEEIAAFSHDAAVAAEDTGALEQAAEQTADEVEEGLSFGAKAALGAAAGLLALVVVVKLA